MRMRNKAGLRSGDIRVGCEGSRYFVFSLCLLLTGIALAQSGEKGLGEEFVYPATLDAMGLVRTESYFKRLALLRKASNNLSSDQITALREFLCYSVDEAGLNNECLHAFKNEIANILLNQKMLPDGIVGQFIEMAEEERQGSVWRDYCVQHLGGVMSRLSDADREQCAEFFFKKTKVFDAGIAGTALIALSLNVDTQEIEKRSLAERAYEVAIDEEMDMPSRITAIQIAASHRSEKILSLARQLVDSSGNINLRASSLAALGSLGTDADLLLLEKYVNSGRYRLRTAACAALKRLETRLLMKKNNFNDTVSSASGLRT